ncbi:hypothetical protein [Nocardia mexicana]|uniref:Mce-associated membrane protein n=1 Tax=Nocardia mexicana TaxID=279262 RepID=A0A370GN82_9NOCA|nr:hypothetical protein [Nocardia mexicana]RDI45041.1 Mce-associated membrane protein [Nocardia mexicana]
MKKTSVVTPDQEGGSVPPDTRGEAADETVGDSGEAAVRTGAGGDAETGGASVGDLTPAGSDIAVRHGRSWRRWLPRPLTAVLTMLLAVAVVLAVVFGWKLEDRNDRNEAGRAALAAAQDYAVALTSIDASRIDADFATVLNGATGRFKDMYSQSSGQLKPMLLQAKSVSKGRVVAAGVRSASENQAVVMLFVDAEITNVTNPEPRIDRNRILMTMDRVDGRWLASEVELP